MRWHVSHRAERSARLIADRHYNRQKVGADQFVPPGRCTVLVIPDAALWVTSWPFSEYVKHQWAGAWVNSCFRNERRDLYLSSDLILEAIAATLYYWSPPPEGLVTFVDETKTKHKRDPGRCYRKAGFEVVGRTKTENLLALHLCQEKIRRLAPTPPLGETLSLFGLGGF